MSEQANPWRNRIVGHGEADPASLKAHPSNWRTHPVAQASGLSAVLDDVGIVQGVIVNRATGLILDGHLRVEAAIGRGQPTMPVTYVELSEEEERIILATFDPLGGMAGTDTGALAGLLGEIGERDGMLGALLEMVGGEGNDPDRDWSEGTPEYVQPDASGIKIAVHFRSTEDRDEFARRLGVKVTDRTNSIWFPPMQVEKTSDKVEVAAAPE